MTASWEPQQYSSTETSGGPASAIWAQEECRSLTPNYGRSDPRFTWWSRREKHCRSMEWRRWQSSATHRPQFDIRHTWSQAQGRHWRDGSTEPGWVSALTASRPKIHWVPGHSGIPGNEQAHCQANLARHASGSSVIEQPYTSASNSARQIPEGSSAAKAKWDADKCSNHFSYRLKGKVGTKRPIPMTSVKSLAARFHRVKSQHAPTSVYQKRFGHRDDNKRWGCRGTATQTLTRDHLFRQCSQWRDQQKPLLKAVGKATGWKVGRCCHVQVTELVSIEVCGDGLPGAHWSWEVSAQVKWRYGAGPGLGSGIGANGVILFLLCFPFCLSLIFHLSAGTKSSGGELRHLAGSPRGVRDIRLLSYSNKSQYSMITQQQWKWPFIILDV